MSSISNFHGSKLSSMLNQNSCKDFRRRISLSQKLREQQDPCMFDVCDMLAWCYNLSQRFQKYSVYVQLVLQEVLYCRKCNLEISTSLIARSGKCLQCRSVIEVHKAHLTKEEWLQLKQFSWSRLERLNKRSWRLGLFLVCASVSTLYQEYVRIRGEIGWHGSKKRVRLRGQREEEDKGACF